MSNEEKLNIINEGTNQNILMEYVEEGAVEYGITLDEMLDLMIENLE